MSSLSIATINVSGGIREENNERTSFKNRVWDIIVLISNYRRKEYECNRTVIICVQELKNHYGPETIKKFLHKLESTLGMSSIIAYNNSGTDTCMANAILYDPGEIFIEDMCIKRILNDYKYFDKDCNLKIKYESKCAIGIKVNFKGHRFELYNVHVGLRENQQKAAMELFKKIAMETNETIILCGDFNTFKEDWSYNLLKEYKTHYIDTCEELPYTFLGWETDDPQYCLRTEDGNMKYPAVLDHIFIKPGVLGMKILEGAKWFGWSRKDEINFLYKPYGFHGYCSDHIMITLDIDF